MITTTAILDLYEEELDFKISSVKYERAINIDIRQIHIVIDNEYKSIKIMDNKSLCVWESPKFSLDEVYRVVEISKRIKSFSNDEVFDE